MRDLPTICEMLNSSQSCPISHRPKPRGVLEEGAAAVDVLRLEGPRRVGDLAGQAVVVVPDLDDALAAAVFEHVDHGFVDRRDQVAPSMTPQARFGGQTGHAAAQVHQVGGDRPPEMLVGVHSVPCTSSSHANYPPPAGQFATRMIAINQGTIASRVEGLTQAGKVG